jgi:hypothetical protein
LADFARLERHDESVQVVQDRLEPQLARLVHDDEQQFVGMLRLRPRTLQRQQLVERQIGAVGDFVTQNVDTPKDSTSSTAITSVV